ncbi:RNA polymerase sigma factor [Chondrinema litorale]|uniref:RNA polymerase sigma factor n=1 Tax=Chondrinema litorale TaxID=2994555 RepID=UPI000C5128B1|nr:sigma-70 family RNA polymerase sigma factor [Chondrinema litorale]MBT33497.1 RNA polymerase subunit sigma-70 [Thalassovita sp.]UZR95215.1 sigma-70 family RNA polymerase sigma factor [Chondrinema litorale]
MQNKSEFIKIVKQNEGIIYKISRVYTNDEEDQKDLYQEVVYQLWKSFGSFRAESKVSTWMYRIALNTSIAWLNKRKRKPHKISIDFELHNKADEKDTLMEERLNVLYAQIKQLGVVDKGLILLFLEGKSYEEISQITGFTSSNVGTRLARIKQKLKKRILK